jgi:hypothetical protein
MAIRLDPPLLRNNTLRSDLSELAWMDRLLVDEIAEATRRHTLARASNQTTLALALNAQIGCLVRLRQAVHHRHALSSRGLA